MRIRTASAVVVLVLLIGGSEAGRAETVELKYFVEVGVPSFEAAKELIATGFDIAGIDRKSYGTGASGERPDAVGVGACDKPQDLAGTCP